MTRATCYSAPIRKLLADAGLGARQILAVVSDPTPDRTGDVMRPEGCVLDNYNDKNPIVLANHRPEHPIGTAKVSVRNGRVEALIDFAEKGVSQLADEWCGLVKAGVLRALSVGFDPIEFKPNAKGGYDYTKWELLELSVVAVPSNPGATVIARSHGAKDGRVLAQAHADKLLRGHKRISAGLADMEHVIRAAGFEPGAALPPEADEDEELAFAVARLKSARAADLASLDRLDVGGPGAKPPTAELRGGPHLVADVRAREAQRLWAYWNSPLR